MKRFAKTLFQCLSALSSTNNTKRVIRIIAQHRVSAATTMRLFIAEIHPNADTYGVTPQYGKAGSKSGINQRLKLLIWLFSKKMKKALARLSFACRMRTSLRVSPKAEKPAQAAV